MRQTVIPISCWTEDVYKYTKRTLHIKIEESGGTVRAEGKICLKRVRL